MKPYTRRTLLNTLRKTLDERVKSITYVELPHNHEAQAEWEGDDGPINIYLDSAKAGDICAVFHEMLHPLLNLGTLFDDELEEEIVYALDQHLYKKLGKKATKAWRDAIAAKVK